MKIANFLFYLAILLIISGSSTSCGGDDSSDSPCSTCVNGDCVDDVCECEPFWTGVNCDTIQPPTNIIITGLFANGVEPEGPVGPWDTEAGQEAPDLVYYIYDGFYFDRDQFRNLAHAYRSDVSNNWPDAEFSVEDIDVKFDWGSSRTLTILLADNDGNSTAFASNFVELAYLDLPLDYDTIPPYSEEQIAFGTLQNPFNIRVTLAYE